MIKQLYSSMALLALAAVAPASAGFVTQYTVNMDAGTLPVSGIVKFETVLNGGGSSWSDFVDGGGDSGSQTVINQLFASETPRLTALLMGLTYEGYPVPYYGPEISGPVPDAKKHLVLFMSNAAAAVATGNEFSALFPGYAEDDVASWLEVVGLLGVAGVGQEVFDEKSALLDGFAEAAKNMTIPESMGDPTTSAWFAIPAPQVVTGSTDFTVVMFSTGTQVGSGTVLQTGSAVPEPGTWMSLLGGGLAFALLRRRR